MQPDPFDLDRLDDDGNRLRPNEPQVPLTADPGPIAPLAPGAASDTGSGPTDLTERLAGIILTPAAERQWTAAFSQNHSAPEYRERFQQLFPEWWHYNTTYFGGQLTVPHIGIGRVTPRRFADCQWRTDYGGDINIVLADRAAFGTDRRLVRTDDPDALGWRRFLFDLLLGETVKQHVMEILRDDEAGWGGRGPLYCREANRIGAELGLPRVEPRRRAHRGMGRPVAAFWPWALRPPEYYLGHVRFDHLKISGLRPRERHARHGAGPGVYEYFLYLLVTGQVARLTDLMGRVVDADLEKRSPAVAAAERRPIGASGEPLPLPKIDPAWLSWHGECARIIAEGIRTRRTFDDLPILADALQDAGCEDPVLLNHCRAHTTHTAQCWALRLLTEPRPN